MDDPSGTMGFSVTSPEHRRRAWSHQPPPGVKCGDIVNINGLHMAWAGEPVAPRGLWHSLVSGSVTHAKAITVSTDSEDHRARHKQAPSPPPPSIKVNDNRTHSSLRWNCQVWYCMCFLCNFRTQSSDSKEKPFRQRERGKSAVFFGCVFTDHSASCWHKPGDCSHPTQSVLTAEKYSLLTIAFLHAPSVLVQLTSGNGEVSCCCSKSVSAGKENNRCVHSHDRIMTTSGPSATLRNTIQLLSF